MNKRNICLSALFLMLATCLSAQTVGRNQQDENESPCGTVIPHSDWDDWFNAKVEEYKSNLKHNKVRSQTYTIPIIVHIIHGGQAVGTFPNIDSAQVRTQLVALNNDFAGTGFGASGIPAVFQSVLANTDIKFCLAVKNPTGGVLAEPGIDRVNYQTNGWANPASQNGTNAIKNLIDNIVKPATIWDPTRYFNIWISDRGSVGLMGYATFPGGTNLTGIVNSFTGTATSDGVWVYTKSFGTTGNLTSGFTKGRVLAHETGHWLGLRHVWGDGNCLTDYCNDTPPAPHNHGGVANPVHPFHVNQCGSGQSPNGEMFMNFMDYTSSDHIMCMFTLDQKTRMHTTMSQGTYRSLLGTHGLCTQNAAVPGPAASFSFATPPCAGKPFNAINTSTGGPTPGYNWSTNPAANVTISPSPTSAVPAILFGVPGTYTVTLVATNTLNTSTYSTILSVSACPVEPICLDSLKAIRQTDTLRTYTAPVNASVPNCNIAGKTGWLTGTNCYKDREKAQYFAGASYSNTPNPQINSLFVVFDTVGTKGNPNTQIYAKIWASSLINGTPSSSLIAQTKDSLLTILTNTASNNTPIVGNPLHTQSSDRIKVHRFDFVPPVPLPLNGFFASIEMPNSTPGDSLLIFSNTYTNANGSDSSAWVMEFLNNNWRRIKSKYGVNVKLAVIPQITCRLGIGLPEENRLKEDIHFFPNPTNGDFTIITSFNTPRNLTIEWMDCVGKRLEMKELKGVSNETFKSDLGTYPNGLYFLKIRSGNEQVIHKVMVFK